MPFQNAATAVTNLYKGKYYASLIIAHLVIDSPFRFCLVCLFVNEIVADELWLCPDFLKHLSFFFVFREYGGSPTEL